MALADGNPFFTTQALWINVILAAALPIVLILVALVRVLLSRREENRW